MKSSLKNQELRAELESNAEHHDTLFKEDGVQGEPDHEDQFQLKRWDTMFAFILTRRYRA